MIPGEAVEAGLLLDTLEAVETPCDIGRLWDIDLDGNDEPNCPRPAEWSALAHDCHIGKPILLCTKHLAMCREDHEPEQFIKWTCERCKYAAVSTDEIVWNIRRLA